MALNAAELAEHAAASLVAKKAMDVRILDLQGLTSIADYFVIGSAGSEPQMKAIVESVADGLAAEQVRPWHVEGTTAWRWVLIDYVDVVVHVFRQETRAFYGLERLWGDAPVTDVFLDPASGAIQSQAAGPRVQDEKRHEDDGFAFPRE